MSYGGRKMSYKDFDEIESGTPPPWGATEKQIKRDIIDTLVADCITHERDLSGHKHAKIYNGYGTEPIVEGSNSALTIGVVAGSDVDIRMPDAGNVVIRSLPSDTVMFEINTDTNTINIGSGATT